MTFLLHSLIVLRTVQFGYWDLRGKSHLESASLKKIQKVNRLLAVIVAVDSLVTVLIFLCISYFSCPC